MKKLLVILFVALLVSSTDAFAQKELKFGHINSNELLALMPERDSAAAELQRYAQMLQDEMQALGAEYQSKITAYEQKKATYSDLVRQSKEAELQELGRRAQEFQVTAQQDYQQKEAELIQPVMDKAQKAIEKVAKANGFTYVFDLGSGGILYHSEQSVDILPLVKKELGIQ